MIWRDVNVTQRHFTRRERFLAFGGFGLAAVVGVVMSNFEAYHAHMVSAYLFAIMGVAGGLACGIVFTQDRLRRFDKRLRIAGSSVREGLQCDASRGFA